MYKLDINISRGKKKKKKKKLFVNCLKVFVVRLLHVFMYMAQGICFLTL